MARMRIIKPGFFQNEKLADIEPLGRLLFAGLWTEADREGRLEDRPRRIKAAILPYDQCDVDSMLNQLQAEDFLIRYEVEGKQFIQISNFAKHQQPHHKEIPSAIPPPPSTKTLPAQQTQQIEEFSDVDSSLSQAQVNVDSSLAQARGDVNSTIKQERNEIDSSKSLLVPLDTCNGNQEQEHESTPPSARAHAHEIPDPFEHWAVVDFEHELGEKPRLQGAELIAARVVDREVWFRVLGIWKGNRHVAEKVGNVVDRYTNEIGRQKLRPPMASQNGNRGDPADWRKHYETLLRNYLPHVPEAVQKSIEAVLRDFPTLTFDDWKERREEFLELGLEIV